MNTDLDPFAVTEVLADLNQAWQENREAFSKYCLAFNHAMQSANQKVFSQLKTPPRDTPAQGEDILMHWVNNLSWSSRLYHQVLCEALDRYVDQAPDLGPQKRQYARFWMRQIEKMLEPANYFWTNPKAVQRLVETRGESLQKGLRNWMEDVQANEGFVSLADRESFQVGRNLAVTPGNVIFRNELMELIQYAPQTPKVWKIPIVMVQPWINKYYIFDLSPRNSFVAYLVRRGFSVFIISWKNPGPQMRHVTFYDYMLRGALQAINLARQVCRCSRVHLTGYCIGGTLITALMGWLAGGKTAAPVTDVTLFSTLADFSHPGDLGAMIHPKAIAAIEEMVNKNGILSGHQISAAFRLLNPGDLVWRYVTNNYFYGEAPPRSDMLYWNSDGTNLPQVMCLFYLKSFYIKNLMTRPNALKLAGRPIDLRHVQTPFYIVGAAKDHICPWQSTFQTCRLIRGKVRYVLADEGHITGIVNPPSPWSKKKYWAGAATGRRDADKWLDRQTPSKGSWWPDWIRWLQSGSLGLVAPPSMGSSKYPPFEPAPGSYVYE